MKRVLISALGLVLLSAGLTTTASAATEAQKLNAVLNGLAHLDYIQCSSAGTIYWAYGGACDGGLTDAMTGVVLFAFQTQKAKWPSGLAAKYAADVTGGVNYLLQNASTATVSTNNAGQKICPGGAASCTAIYWNISGNPCYATGFVATSIDIYGLAQGIGNVATATGPLAGLTWTQIAQGVTNAYAAAQATAGNQTGGWRYDLPSNTDADMSTSQWGALASGYNESVGAVTPAFVKPMLQTWLAYDISGGAACYEGGTSAFCGIGPTNSENGAWLVSAAWAGVGNQAAAINFLNSNWTATPNAWSGNFGHTYAMWSTYKGLEATIGNSDNTHITNRMTNCGIPTNSPGSGVCNWWEDYNEWLVNVDPNRTTDGATPPNSYWTAYDYAGGWSDPMSTAVFTAIIGGAALPNTITQQAPTAVPAVGRWGLVALGIMLLTFAAMKLRKPQTT